MDVIPKKGWVVRSSRDSLAFDFRDRIELRPSRGRIIDSSANLKQHNTAIGGFIKIANMQNIRAHVAWVKYCAHLVSFS